MACIHGGAVFCLVRSKKRACVCIFYFYIVQNVSALLQRVLRRNVYTNGTIYTWRVGGVVVQSRDSRDIFWQTYYRLRVSVYVCAMCIPLALRACEAERTPTDSVDNNPSLSISLSSLRSCLFIPPSCVCISAMIPRPPKMLLPARGSRVAACFVGRNCQFHKHYACVHKCKTYDESSKKTKYGSLFKHVSVCIYLPYVVYSSLL